MGLAAAGTLVVYGIDRLRDVERDEATSPARSAFVQRHRGALALLVAAAAAAGSTIALQLPAPAWGLSAGVLALGLLHRRLKGAPQLKTLYVSAAWVCVTVGLPVLCADEARAGGDLVPWVVALYTATIAANLVASNLRDAESHARVSTRTALGVAAALCGLAGLCAWIAPAAVRPLAWIPALELVSLTGLTRALRGGDLERYGLVVVDGALGAGALLAIVFAC